MVRRRRRLLFVTLIATGLLFGGGYVQTRPHWRTATQAEFVGALDPVIREAPAVDSKAQRRYETVMRLCDENMRGRRASDLTELREALSQRDATDANITVARGIQESVGVMNAATFGRMLIGRADLEASAGHREKAAELLWLAFTLFDYLRETSGAVIDHIRLHSIITAVPEILPARILGKLDEDGLARVASALPAQPSGDAPLQRAIRREFEEHALPYLFDPTAELSKGGWRQNVAKALAQTGGPDFENGTRVGNFDAFETAAEVNLVVGTRMRNALLPRWKQDPKGMTRSRDLKASLPSRSAAAATGWKEPVYRFLDRIAMNRVPNSYGRVVLYTLTTTDPSIMEQSFLGRTAGEASRALVALWRYRVRHGRPAPSLESLVKEKLLESIPQDFMGQGPLLYDAKRQLLWSRGADGKDQGGTMVGSRSPKSMDWAWAVGP